MSKYIKPIASKFKCLMDRSFCIIKGILLIHGSETLHFQRNMWGGQRDSDGRKCSGDKSRVLQNSRHTKMSFCALAHVRLKYTLLIFDELEVDQLNVKLNFCDLWRMSFAMKKSSVMCLH